MLGKILLFVTLLPLGLALACGIFDERQAVPVEAGPEPRHRVAEQVPDVLRCDVKLRRFLADVSHQAITADGDSAGVSYMQSQHNCPAPASPLTELVNLRGKCQSRQPGLAAGPLRHSSLRPRRQLTRLPYPAATPGARATYPPKCGAVPFSFSGQPQSSNGRNIRPSSRPLPAYAPS